MLSNELLLKKKKSDIVYTVGGPTTVGGKLGT